MYISNLQTCSKKKWLLQCWMMLERINRWESILIMNHTSFVHTRSIYPNKTQKTQTNFGFLLSPSRMLKWQYIMVRKKMDIGTKKGRSWNQLKGWANMLFQTSTCMCLSRDLLIQIMRKIPLYNLKLMLKLVHKTSEKNCITKKLTNVMNISPTTTLIRSATWKKYLKMKITNKTSLTSLKTIATGLTNV